MLAVTRYKLRVTIQDKEVIQVVGGWGKSVSLMDEALTKIHNKKIGKVVTMLMVVDSVMPTDIGNNIYTPLMQVKNTSI